MTGPPRSGRTARRSATRRAPSGRSPAAVSAAVGASLEPARPRSAPRSTLRRWRERGVDDGEDLLAVRRRGRWLAPGPGDEAGVDVGRRPEDVAADRARSADVGVPRGLDARARRTPSTPAARPAGRRPRTAPSPAPARDSAAARRDGAAPAPTRCRAGWPPGRWGAAPGRSSTRIASAATTSQRPASSGAYAASVSGSAAASTGSTSIATTRRTSPSRPSVSDPSPGPTSTTVSSGLTPAARTIRRTVLASMTKFCPRCLVGWIPSRDASTRTSAGPRSVGPADVASVWLFRPSRSRP